MDIHGSWIQQRHIDIHLYVSNKLVIRHGYYMDCSLQSGDVDPSFQSTASYADMIAPAYTKGRGYSPVGENTWRLERTYCILNER